MASIDYPVAYDDWIFYPRICGQAKHQNCCANEPMEMYTVDACDILNWLSDLWSLYRNLSLSLGGNFPNNYRKFHIPTDEKLTRDSVGPISSDKNLKRLFVVFRHITSHRTIM